MTTEIPPRPLQLDARVRRRACADPAIAARSLDEPEWTLHVTHRRPGVDPSEVTSILPLSDEFAAFQIDLYLRTAQRGDRAAARLLFAALHEEWGRTRLTHRDPAWDALFTFLAPLAAEDTIAA